MNEVLVIKFTNNKKWMEITRLCIFLPEVGKIFLNSELGPICIGFCFVLVPF